MLGYVPDCLVRMHSASMSILDKFLVAGFWFLFTLGVTDAILSLGPWWP